MSDESGSRVDDGTRNGMLLVPCSERRYGDAGVDRYHRRTDSSVART
jgi:hypothetical protein